jgi:predicted nucleotidyltransferase/predicted transcriptional regulator with HTH domain
MISLRSEITKKILNYFFINPHESLYVNELSRKLNLDKRNLVKKIRELEKEGILVYQSRGNLKLYTINKKYPLYGEYRKIIITTVGFEGRLRNALQGMKGIKEAYVYGSYAKDKMDVHSDIDLLVVGDESSVEVLRHIKGLQKEIEREINVVNMGEAEFRRRIKNKDPFILDVRSKKQIKII